nr:hypothetical protein Iba_chr02bCG12720 [Ipomoea batatas]
MRYVRVTISGFSPAASILVNRANASSKSPFSAYPPIRAVHETQVLSVMVSKGWCKMRACSEWCSDQVQIHNEAFVARIFQNLGMDELGVFEVGELCTGFCHKGEGEVVGFNAILLHSAKNKKRFLALPMVYCFPDATIPVSNR